jgi:hypothetical protein
MVLVGVLGAGCGKVNGAVNGAVTDARMDQGSNDDAAIDGPGDGAIAALGTKDNPAHTCAELHVAGIPSGTAWLRSAASQAPAFQVYCEQTLSGGGWAMVENSVRRDDGTTRTFWQFKYADRLSQLGTPAADQNYYDGSLYLIGSEYMDLITDLQGRTVVAIIATATGFDKDAMKFIGPVKTMGNDAIYNSQFASGWASQDHDADPDANNCAVLYSNIAQHYNGCWSYNLGSNAGRPPLDDGGVGPHVLNSVIDDLTLARQPGVGAGDGVGSQVKRIARFTRW